MHKFTTFIVLSLLVVSKSEDSISSVDWFSGRWFPAITYPLSSWIPICDWMELIHIQPSNCTCGDKEVPSVFLVYGGRPLGVTSVIIINSLAEKEDALNQECNCDGKHEVQGVYRKINENYFVIYSRTSSNPDYAMLMLQKMPKLSQLRAVLRTIEDLKDRKPGYMCDPNIYVNEFDNLE